MAIQKNLKPIAMPISIIIMAIGVVTMGVAFLQDFGNMKINENLLIGGIAIVGLGIALAVWFVISYGIDIIKEIMTRKK